jgi:hypothetical protein
VRYSLIRMLRSERRWNAALAEHEGVVREFLEICSRCAPSDWHVEPAPEQWSTAAVALHICRTYEMAMDAMQGGPSMGLRVSKPYAWLLRTFMLPAILATKRFPRGVRVPREVAPNLEEAKRLTPAAAARRLKLVAAEAAAKIRRTGRNRPAPLMTHAYFGPLAPYTALRLLSAHTQHHTRVLAEG